MRFFIKVGFLAFPKKWMRLYFAACMVTVPRGRAAVSPFAVRRLRWAHSPCLFAVAQEVTEFAWRTVWRVTGSVGLRRTSLR